MKPNANEGSGRIPTGKGKPKAKGRYGWGDGKGRIHSIPRSQHTKNVTKRRENIRQNDPAAFTQPRSLNDVTRDAGTSADLRYGGQERALGLQAQQVPAWFAQYRAQVQGINQGIQQGYQKAIGDVTAQAQQTAASDTTARNSLASTMQNDAASRGATVDPKLLGNDVNAANVRNTNQAAFANLLGAQGQAQNSYFGGLQTAGSAAELGQKTRISQEQAGVATDKGLYKSQYVTDAKDTERKYGLEKAAFGLDVDKAKADAQQGAAKIKSDRAKVKQDAKDKRAARKVSRKNTRDQIASSNRNTDARGRQQAAAKREAARTKDPTRISDKRDKSRAGLGRLDDINGRWHSYRTQLVTETTTGKDGKKKDIKRKPTPQDVTNRILGESGPDGHKFSAAELHLARLLREHKRFGPADVAMAHRLGISVPANLRPAKSGGSHFHGTHGG